MNSCTRAGLRSEQKGRTLEGGVVCAGRVNAGDVVHCDALSLARLQAAQTGGGQCEPCFAAAGAHCYAPGAAPVLCIVPARSSAPAPRSPIAALCTVHARQVHTTKAASSLCYSSQRRHLPVSYTVIGRFFIAGLSVASNSTYTGLSVISVNCARHFVSQKPRCACQGK